MKQNAIDIVKKFMPYTRNFVLQINIKDSIHSEINNFRNAVECARIFIANAKIICPYVSRKYRETVHEIRCSDYQFVDYWIEIEGELNQLTLDDIK